MQTDLCIFDSHTHYTDAAFDPDRDALLRSFPEKGIAGCMVCGTDLATSADCVSLAAQYPELLIAAVGVHPECPAPPEGYLQELERLVCALAEIKRRYMKDPNGLMSQEYIAPEVVYSPQEAFYADKESVPLEESAGYVCSEFVMCYPPGIPILAPGERITKEILEYIAYAKAKGCSLTGPEDPTIEHINIIREGEKFAWNSGSVNATLRMSNTACG